jgi:hypothetical protein
LFSKKEEPTRPVAPWEPTVDLAVARDVVLALASAPAAGDAQVRYAIAEFIRASGRPSLLEAIDLMQREPDVIHRPWIWLGAVIRDAATAGDDRLAAAGLFWACYWTSQLVPRMSGADFIGVELDPIPPAFKAVIAAEGIPAARRLPPDFAIVGDATGDILAGPLANAATTFLGI